MARQAGAAKLVEVVRRLRKLAESRVGIVGMTIAVAWAAIVFGFFFSFKAREMWPKVVEVFGGG